MARTTKEMKGARTPFDDPHEKARRDAVIAQETAHDETRGRQYAAEFYYPGRLGRIGPQLVPSAQDMLGRRRDFAARMKEGDADNKELMKRHMAGLDGISSKENQALREAGTREIKSTEAENLYNLKRFGGQAGVKGQAMTGAAVDVMRDSARNQALFESDLVARNVAEKQSRLNAASEFSNSNLYRQFLGENAALQGLASDTWGQQQYLTGMDIFNLGQENKEHAGYIDTFYGQQALESARREGVRQLQYGDEALDIAMELDLFGNA